MEFYAAERKKEFIPFAMAWMELESIMLSENWSSYSLICNSSVQISISVPENHPLTEASEPPYYPYHIAYLVAPDFHF